MLSFPYQEILNHPSSIYIHSKKGPFQFSKPTFFKLNTDIRFKYKKLRKFAIEPDSSLPLSFDSSTKSLSTKVMNQGDCGCCFAVSTATCISDVFSIGLNMSFNPNISPMYILSSIPGNNKCDGGNPYDTLEYIQDNGVATDICVSYEEACLDEEKCDNNIIPSKGCCNNKVDHYLYYVSNIRVETDITLIKQHIYKYGCAIAGFIIYQSFLDFGNNYNGSIYIDRGTDLNEQPKGFHAICIIGWGTENGINYWLCRNSWGTSWGTNGYFKFAMYSKGINERNALEITHETKDSNGNIGDIGGIILFDPNGANKKDLPLSDCSFMNNLDTTLKKQLLSFYGTNENDPTDKNGKTIIKPVNKINNNNDNYTTFLKENKKVIIIVSIIIGIIILLSLIL